MDLGSFFSGMGQAAGGGLIGAGMNAINQAINYKYATKMADYNFNLNEKAADSADARRRALYQDYESPLATIRQLKEAGLSPSLYAGGEIGGSIGSTSGAQGAGASGLSIPGNAGNPVDLASINLMNAQAEKAKADAGKTITETEIAEINKQLKEIDFAKAGVDANLLLGYVSDKDGNNKQSFAEIAKNSTSYTNFIKTLKDKGANGIESEQAQRTLREIYKSNKLLGRDIAILSEETINADFQKSIINFLNQKGFAEMNAESAIAELNAAIATNTLTESQKDAWNNVIDELKQANPTMANIAIILGMIVDRFAGQMVNKVSIGPTNTLVVSNKQ